MTSHSPVWRPARTSSPRRRTSRTTAHAHRTPRAGASNAARNPSPAVSISRPSNRASLFADDRVVAAQEFAPAAVTKLRGPGSRANDVREHHGGQDPVGYLPVTDARARPRSCATPVVSSTNSRIADATVAYTRSSRSTRRAPEMLVAIRWPTCTGTQRFLLLWITRVGAVMRASAGEAR
jgi:hypothetical protein